MILKLSHHRCDNYHEHIELMNLEGDNIKVAEYLLILPSEKVLLEKLHRSIEIARNKFENKK